MNQDKLLSQLKNMLLIPDQVDKFDPTLKATLAGSKEYIDNITDSQPPATDDLYILNILLLSEYHFMNRDNPKLTKSFPIGLDSTLNKLRDKYRN